MMISSKPRVLAVVPARGGSKRLPRKNIRLIGGEPMIVHTLRAVAEAELVTDWLVSSDDDEIIEIAERFGAPVPFKRPSELATDDIRNIDVALHALEFMEAEKQCAYDIIVLLQPTSPIRSPQHIDEAITKLHSSTIDSLAAVKGPFKKRDPILKRIDSSGNLVAYCESREEHNEPFFVYNAAMYAVKRDYFVRERKFVADVQIPFVMDKYHSIDVDEVSDAIVAEAYLAQISKEQQA